MKAIVYTEYGPPDVLRFVDVPKPAPRDHEVLIRIRAASLNPLDWHFMRGTPYVMRMGEGLRAPKVPRLGVDVAGQVEAAGKHVTGFRPGDAVFGTCKGAFAEYVCASEEAVVLKPANLTFEQAAAVPVAGLSALQALRDRGNLQPGQSVLINGASGGVGTFAVQLARVFGAVVTGVCSTRNVELVRSIGAHHVIDYTREDFTSLGRRYDVILDAVSNHSPLACRRALTPRGTLVVVGSEDRGRWLGPLTALFRTAVLSPFVRQKLLPFMARMRTADLLVMCELLANNQVAPVIDRSYPLGDAAEAIRYLEEGHARGKVLLTMAG